MLNLKHSSPCLASQGKIKPMQLLLLLKEMCIYNHATVLCDKQQSSSVQWLF